VSAIFKEQIARRREEPGDDTISILTKAELDGYRLSDEEILPFLRVIMPAGAETTMRGIANLFVGLMRYPDQLQLLLDDPTLMPKAVDESLRWEPPVTDAFRLAMRDTRIGDVDIPAGSGVIVCLASANRDPRVFDEPERFDIKRAGSSPHMAFGYGAHVCIGMHLARTEMAVAVGDVLARCPNLRFDPSQPEPVITGLNFRSPEFVPVVFDPHT
jgi:cytochrome P450